MKQIPLTQEKFALVDEADFEELSKYKWYVTKSHRDLYARRKVHKTNSCIYMHRQILGLTKKDKMDTDHINHNTLDNRRCNLRICTRSQNNQNGIKQANCSSKLKGVSWYKRDKKWRAYITYYKQTIHLGYFDSEIEAAIAYNKKAEELFGEFARLNNVA